MNIPFTGIPFTEKPEVVPILQETQPSVVSLGPGDFRVSHYNLPVISLLLSSELCKRTMTLDNLES